MKAYEDSIISSDGKSRIFYTAWCPDGEPRALLQLSHGMSEYADRYAPFARYMAERGYLVFGNDHLGHGRSAADGLLGYMPRGGADILVDDLHRVADQVTAKYSGLPRFLMGHSMGSFVARLYLSRYGDSLDGCIIMGTAGPGQPTAAGKLLSRLVGRVKGGEHRSGLIDSVAFGSYCKGLGRGAHKFAWLSRDAESVAAYDADELCGFVFTADAFYTLFDLLGRVSEAKWADTVPKQLPLLLISGEADPVGGYGKGVRKVYDRLRVAGVKQVDLLTYPNARHELLWEVTSCRDRAYSALAAWVEEKLNEKSPAQEAEGDKNVD